MSGRVSSGNMDVNQLELNLFSPLPERTVDELQAELREFSGREVILKTNRNRVTRLSLEFCVSGVLKVRMHEAFLSAPGEVIDGLKKYVRTRRRRYWNAVRDYAETIDCPEDSIRSRTRINTRGRFFDLAAIAGEVNETFFSGSVKSSITWGRQARGRRRKRSIRFGAYDREADLVRISPRLDSKVVPCEFVRYIVFHEMLHSVIPSVKQNGRWVHHPPEFRAREKQYPGFARIRRMSKNLLERI